jgi:integrase
LRTVCAQNSAPSPRGKVKFPQTIRYRKVEVILYGRTEANPYYRIGYHSQGKRHLLNFKTYSEAKTEAERKARELSQGSTAPALTAKQALDALTAFERLEAHRQSTGRQVTLLSAVSQFSEASARLNGRSLAEAVTGFLANVANVQRKDLSAAVEEYLAAAEPRTIARDGERPQLAPAYYSNLAIQLRRFAGTFPNTAVCDLTKAHLTKFIESLKDFAPKTRNHYRTAIKSFWAWCERRDYLSRSHRLDEADGMHAEKANHAEVGIYTPKELAILLGSATGPLQAMLAIGGLAGLRSAELLRLSWPDVWRIPGMLEVTAQKAKTRQRRLVEIVPALAQWLEPFRSCTSGPVWSEGEDVFQLAFTALCKSAGIERKANALRHSFCSYHFALHSNESLTAQQAGNSPAMVHANYKALATATDAQKWFAVAPVVPGNVIPMAPQAVNA